MLLMSLDVIRRRLLGIFSNLDHAEKFRAGDNSPGVAGMVIPFVGGELDKVFAIRRPNNCALAVIVALLGPKIIAAGGPENLSGRKIDNVILMAFLLHGVDLVAFFLQLLVPILFPIGLAIGQA